MVRNAYGYRALGPVIYKVKNQLTSTLIICVHRSHSQKLDSDWESPGDNYPGKRRTRYEVTPDRDEGESSLKQIESGCQNMPLTSYGGNKSWDGSARSVLHLISEFHFDCNSSTTCGKNEEESIRESAVRSRGWRRSFHISQNTVGSPLTTDQIVAFSNEFSTNDKIPLAELRKKWVRESKRVELPKRGISSNTFSPEDNIPLALLRDRRPSKESQKPSDNRDAPPCMARRRSRIGINMSKRNPESQLRLVE